MDITKPLLIFPKLVEQPTWGGTYIGTTKGWQDRDGIKDRKIGQSYELFGDSPVTSEITDTADERFAGYRVDAGHELSGRGEIVNIRDLSREHGPDVLGPDVAKRFGTMPLLIKFTQALGNSFQLHVKPSETAGGWQSKAESWYFLEPGRITLGIRPDTDVGKYQYACRQIESHMKILSKEVKSGRTGIDDARKLAMQYIRDFNPWQYVNVYSTAAGDLIDLSGGGLHHSWEEDSSLPNGNIVYEVQQDVADDRSTLRSFDQGKIKNDGSVRPITVTDYFTYLDTDRARNDIENARIKPDGERLLRTSYYAMDRLTVSGSRTENTGGSFHHLWVLSGSVTVGAGKGSVRVGRGHSCLVPDVLGSYTVTAEGGDAVILKTFIGKEI